MKQHHKFSKEQQEQQEIQHQQEAKAELEFDTPEKLLRHDASHVVVPPRVEQKLQESISALPPEAKRSWWKRVLGG